MQARAGAGGGVGRAVRRRRSVPREFEMVRRRGPLPRASDSLDVRKTSHAL